MVKELMMLMEGGGRVSGRHCNLLEVENARHSGLLSPSSSKTSQTNSSSISCPTRYYDICIIIRDIPSEKIGQNIHPPESCFFVVNYQHWTGTSEFRPFLAPLDHWGGLGGPG